MSQMLKNAAWLFILALLAAAAFWKFSRKENRPSYELIRVSKGDIESTVAAIGTLQPIQSVEVGAQVSGQILRIHVEPGHVVEKNQLLAEIDASVPQAAVDAGLAALADLRAQLSEQEALAALAVRQLDRQRALFADEITSKEQLEAAEANLNVTQAKLAQLNAQIVQRSSTQKGDEAQLGYTRIYAPVSGTVISVEAKVGQTLNATYQTPAILRIADLSKMTVWTDVAEADISRVREGMPATFTTLGNQSRRWRGTVRQILHMPPVSDAKDAPPPEFGKVIYYTVLFDVENHDHALMPRMTTQVNILTDSAKNVVIAPLAALTPQKNEADGWHARVITQAGDEEARNIKTGKRDRKSAEIISGLQEGDQLIVSEIPDTSDKRFIW
ncbi:MAG: efflux RND transporter periplasmic adaptor subunit [Luteolibacter sp.]